MVPLHSDLALVCCSEETLALTPTLSPTRGGRTQSALEFSCALVRRRLMGIYVGCSIFNGRQAPVCAFLFALVGLVGGRLSAGDTNSVLSAWLSSQTNLQTWSATVIQTRALKSLTRPLTATGHVWFAAPNRFRWELGDPPQTIAVRQADQMLVIYPTLKRAERYPLTGEQTGPWRDTLALLEAGFPRSPGELESRFRLVRQTTSNHVQEVTLQPRSASARRLMPQIKIAFTTDDFALRATEVQFADGSTMRNDFTGAVSNSKLDEAMFSPRLEDDFKMVEPLKRK